MLAFIVATTLLGQPQVDPNKILDTIIPKVDYKNVEVHSALRKLFHRVHAPYRIVDPIQGRVTLHLENKKFELVLQNVLNQASRTYRFEKGKFVILDRGDHFDIESWYLHKHVPAFDFRKTDVREAIKELCRSADVTYSIAVEPEGIVGFKLHAGTFSQSLKSLLEPLALTYTYENNTFAFMYKGPRPWREIRYDDLQQATFERPIPAIDFQDVDIRDAIQELFRTTGIKYVLDPHVQGNVTLHLTNTTFDYTLKSLLTYFGGKYHFENGAIQITGHGRIFAGGGPEDISMLINGQENINREKFNFKDTDLREALKLIFRGANASYAISPDIQGKVTLDATHLQFGDSLYQILDQVDATYRWEGGVFMIVKRQNEPLDGNILHMRIQKVNFENTDVHEALNELFANVKLRYIISPDVQGKTRISLKDTNLQGALFYVLGDAKASYWHENDTFKIVPEPKFPEGILDHIVPKLDADNGDIRECLKQLFRSANAQYIIPPDVQGKVTIHEKDTKFELILQRILDPAIATYRVDRGAFQIIRRELTGMSRPEPVGDFDRTIYGANYDNVDIREALMTLLSVTNASFEIDPKIQGVIDLHFSRMPFEKLLELLLEAANATCHYKDGKFTVTRRKQ